MAAGTFGFRLEDRKGREGIDGLREIQRDMRRLGDDTKTAMKPTHQQAADIVAEGARRRAPVRSGRLRKSIKGTAVMTGGRVRIGYGGGEPSLYAGPIHFGWPARRIRPQPFVYDELDARRPEVVQLYAERISELIRIHKLAR